MKRYKVIEHYPNSPFEVGDVLTELYEGNGWLYAGEVSAILISDADKCKAIFKELQWWEDVPVEELPKYLRHKSGHIIEMRSYSQSTNEGVDNVGCTVDLSYFTPATESEYNEYLKNK